MTELIGLPQKQKDIVFFTVADDKNLEYFKIFAKTLHHFHPDIPLVLFDQKDCEATNDPEIYYKQKPFFANRLFNKGYKTVIGFDSDQIVLGNLDYIINADYDVGTVLNINRVDPGIYGYINIATIAPNEYFNCGLVALKSHDFVKHWLNMCYSPHYNRTRFKEQDLLNLLCHYGNYLVRCFDMYDVNSDYKAWHGLVAKGEMKRTLIKDGEVILPKGDDKYPDSDIKIKVYHAGGGNALNKLDYKKIFSRKVAEYIDKILNEQKN